jgi:hypothetical protein
MSTAGNDDKTPGKPTGQSNDDKSDDQSRSRTAAGAAGPLPGEPGQPGATASTGVAVAVEPGQAATRESAAAATVHAAPAADESVALKRAAAASEIPAPRQAVAAAPRSEDRPAQGSAPKPPPKPPKPPKAPRPSGPTPGEGMSKRTVTILVVLAALVATIAAVWIAGSQNSQNYYLRCGRYHITAERGAFFPPWGEGAMSGPAWKPIEFILPTAQCDDQAFTDAGELEAQYRHALLSQADRWLASLRPQDPREHLDTVQKQLEQALLLSRSSDGASVAAREKVGHLLGDIEYWRAHNELMIVQKQLAAAAERFTAAVERSPVHMRDADPWRRFVSHLEQEISAGPPALRTGQAGRADEQGSGAATPDQPRAPGPATQPAPGAPDDSPGPDAAPRPDAAPGMVLPAEPDAAAPPSTTMPGSGTLL